MKTPKRILGLDPGLQKTGWGVIDQGSKWIDHGVIRSLPKAPIEKKLSYIFEELQQIMQTYAPQEVSLEQIFINTNPTTTLKLGMARGIAAMMPGLYNLPLHEYPANKIKKAVVGYGHCDKAQVIYMMQLLLSPLKPLQTDSADALAIALCHAYHEGVACL